MAKVVIIGSIDESLIRFRGQLLKDMINLGHDVIAFAPETSNWVRHELGKSGVNYQDYTLQRNGLNPLVDLACLKTFITAFQKIKPDVVLAYTVKPVIYGSISASIAKVASVNSMITGLGDAFSSDSFKQCIVRKIVVLLYRIALRKNKVVFFQNPDDLAEFNRLKIINGRNVPTIINGSGVDLDHYANSKVPKETSFLMVSRLIDEKGVRIYAEAARELHVKFPNVKFRLVGMIEQKSSSITEEEISEWVKGGFIEYLGRLDDVRPAIRDASVYTLPSYYREGIPRSILEAMSMGRPIITTDSPGCRETVVENRNGFLIPTKNVRELKKAMEKFVLNPELIKRMGLESRLLAEERFDVRHVNKVILGKLGLL